MKKLWYSLILGFLAFAVSTPARAQNIGLNFAATDPDAATSSLNPTDVAGAVPQANWNNLTLDDGTSSTLVKSDGSTAAGTSVTWASNNTWRSTGTTNNAFPAGPDRVLMAGYLDTLDTAAGGATVTVNNIDAAVRSPSYDVYVYFLGDSGANRGGGYTINDGVTSVLKYGSTMNMPTMHVEDPGTDINLAQDGTYLRFRRLTGSSFTLNSDTTLTTPNGFRAPINAVQIVHRTVGPGDVDQDGDVDITDFHILRGNLFKTGQTELQGDLDGGGVVDFADYRIWKRNAPAGVAASVSLNVPEPASAMILAIAAALVAFSKRRTFRWSH
ncbi:MAG TPA: hypothetical protein VJ828_04090 [Lacipirellulaceae bacterium]|nr:hypothetical protein [Lacipirellulaceae bacterium]